MLDGQRKYSEKTKYIEKLSMCAWNYLMKWQDEKGDRKEIFKKKTDCSLWNSITELLLIHFFARLQNFTRFYVGKYFFSFLLRTCFFGVSAQGNCNTRWLSAQSFSPYFLYVSNLSAEAFHKIDCFALKIIICWALLPTQKLSVIFYFHFFPF